jgi:hypothetical protein
MPLARAPPPRVVSRLRYSAVSVIHLTEGATHERYHPRPTLEGSQAPGRAEGCDHLTAPGRRVAPEGFSPPVALLPLRPGAASPGSVLATDTA